MDVDEYPAMNSSIDGDSSAQSGEEDLDDILVYKDTLSRRKESTKEKSPDILSITLTPSVSTDSIVLLTTSPQTPNSETSYSAPSSGRSTPSVSFNDHIEIFEIPTRDGVEPEEEEPPSIPDHSEISTSRISGCFNGSEGTNNTHLGTGSSNIEDSSDNGDSAPGTPRTGRKPWAAMIASGIRSPRPKRRFSSMCNPSVQKVDASNLTEVLNQISGIANTIAPGTISSLTEVGETITRHAQRGMEREDTFTGSVAEIETVPDNQEVKEKKVKPILKGGGLGNNNSATVMLMSEESGTHFKTRCIRLRGDDEAKIGRCIKANGTLPDESNAIFDCRVLSRQHASIYYKDGSFYLRDLKSSNGTYLVREGKSAMPIDKSTTNHTLEIFSGDVLQFGQDVYEGSRSDSNNNDDDGRDQRNVNKCIRTRLKLFHPSKLECKSRCCDDDNAVTENGNASGDEDNEQNNREFNRCDSLVIHDVPENNKISSVNDELKSPTEAAESSSSNTIQSLLKSIRTETFNIQNFLVAPEGKKADEVSSSAKHPDILEKLEKLERLIVAASHTTNKQRLSSEELQKTEEIQTQSSSNGEEVELRKNKGRKNKKQIDDSTLVKRSGNIMSYPTIELKGDLRGCVEKCREIAGVGAAVVAHEGTDTKLGNLAELAKVVTEKIRELEIRLKNEEFGERLSVLERRTEVSYTMIKYSNTAITYISIFFAMIAILFLLRDGIRENHRRLSTW